jgi:hypothetical protein
MNLPTTCALAHLDAAYVLGALSTEERLEFERHLPGCPACSRAVQDLAGMPGLLAQVSPEVIESDPVPEPLPETLLPALVREVRRRQRRRRWVTGLAAAAAVLAVGAGSVAVVDAVHDEQPSSTVSTGQPMTQLGQHDLLADVALTSVPWGTRLDLTCRYAASGGEYAESVAAPYSLVVRSREGDVEQVATWNALPGKTMTLAGATAMRRDDIASVEVRDPDGRPVLKLPG